jgi:polyhydroxyalkanoate synthesis regulator phasin|tara:strand:+ start:1764 stop:1919 length:156 start_codon:yes stop_codon:yes gene_type:complete
MFTPTYKYLKILEEKRDILQDLILRNKEITELKEEIASLKEVILYLEKERR